MNLIHQITQRPGFDGVVVVVYDDDCLAIVRAIADYNIAVECLNKARVNHVTKLVLGQRLNQFVRLDGLPPRLRFLWGVVVAAV